VQVEHSIPIEINELLMEYASGAIRLGRPQRANAFGDAPFNICDGQTGRPRRVKASQQRRYNRIARGQFHTVSAEKLLNVVRPGVGRSRLRTGGHEQGRERVELSGFGRERIPTAHQ
jgi:hypothetical protein